MKSEFKSTHDLPFMSAEWNNPIGMLLGGGWMLYKIGTVEGQWRCHDGAYQILSFLNDVPGNGHLQDVFDWFENSCKRDKKALQVLELFNERFATHLISKRGFIKKNNATEGSEYLEKTFS